MCCSHQSRASHATILHINLVWKRYEGDDDNVVGSGVVVWWCGGVVVWWCGGVVRSLITSNLFFFFGFFVCLFVCLFFLITGGLELLCELTRSWPQRASCSRHANRFMCGDVVTCVALVS